MLVVRWKIPSAFGFNGKNLFFPFLSNATLLFFTLQQVQPTVYFQLQFGRHLFQMSQPTGLLCFSPSMPVARSRQSLSAKMWKNANKDIAFSIFQFFQNDVFFDKFYCKKRFQPLRYILLVRSSSLTFNNVWKSWSNFITNSPFKLKHLCRRLFWLSA